MNMQNAGCSKANRRSIPHQTEDSTYGEKKMMRKRIHLQPYASPCGRLLLGSIDGKLCLCNWTVELHPGRVGRRLQALLQAEYREEPSDVTREAARQLDEYFRHEREAFTLPLLFAGTPFQEKVWRQLLEIPYGQTISYRQLAEHLGMPRSVRAVANANGANAISIFAPCHRVVGSNGSLAGFGGGIAAKRFLLELERGK